MRAYLLRRILLTIPTIIGVSIIIFLSIRLIPGEVIDLMLDETKVFSDASRAELEKRLGLDVSVFTQYGRWLGIIPHWNGEYNGLFQGSLGKSVWRDVSVLQEIRNRMPVTLELTFIGMLTAVILAIPLGVYSAIRQDTAGDYISRTIATLLISVPNFWVAVVLILFASLWLGISPALSVTRFIEDPIRNIRQFLPAGIILGLSPIGTCMRMTRSMMLEVLRHDYVRTAWAKGLRERVVIQRHALKNALIPVVTLLGLNLRTMLGGTVIIESVFSLPGIGTLLVDSVTRRDYNIVSGVIFVYAIILLLINLAVDLSYAYLDPRIRTS